MQFLVVNLLPPESDTELRLATRADHLAYVAERAALVSSGGRLCSDDGATVLGGYYVLECGSRADAEAFMAGEPYRQKGIWKTEFITAIG